MTVIVWCHGGCFGGGNASYDAWWRDNLTQRSYTVIGAEFSLSSFDQAIEDVSNMCQQTGAAIIAGISSGGFIAHLVAEKLHIPAILIAPVLKPSVRHSQLPAELQQLQIKSFGTMENMRRWENIARNCSGRRIIMLGLADDIRARMDWLPMDWLYRPYRHSIFLINCDHHQLCQQIPNYLFDQLADAIKNIG